MSSKVELVRLVLKDVLRVQITEAEAEKVLERIEALHEKEAVEHSVQSDWAMPDASSVELEGSALHPYKGVSK